MFPGNTESVNFEGDVSFGRSQSLTNREKKQARENLGLNKEQLLSSFMDLVNVRAEEIAMSKYSINLYTIRFSFSDFTYDPTKDNKGEVGVWNKMSTTFSNVWDWTYENTDWSYAFGTTGWNVESSKCFQDPNNLVKIIATNTKDVVNFGRCFQACWSITEIWTMNFDSAENVRNLFSGCTSLKYIPSFYFPVATDIKCLFQRCDSIIELPYMKFDEGLDFDHYAYGMKNLKISHGFDAPKATDYRDLYEDCKNLQELTYMGDTSKVQIWHDCFGGCISLTKLPDTIDMTSGTDCSGVFSFCTSLQKLPNIIWGNNVTTLYGFLCCCASITEIPDMSVFHYVQDFRRFMDAAWTFDHEQRGEKTIEMAIKYLPSWFPQQATDVEYMFYGCKNIENGISTWYTFLSNKSTTVTSHDGCFELCGVNTEQGRKQLEEVPDDWK